jgi:hypothetical protein
MTGLKMSAGVDGTMNIDSVFHNILHRETEAILVGNYHHGARVTPLELHDQSISGFKLQRIHGTGHSFSKLLAAANVMEGYDNALNAKVLVAEAAGANKQREVTLLPGRTASARGRTWC